MTRRSNKTWSYNARYCVWHAPCAFPEPLLPRTSVAAPSTGGVCLPRAAPPVELHILLSCGPSTRAGRPIAASGSNNTPDGRLSSAPRRAASLTRSWAPRLNRSSSFMVGGENVDFPAFVVLISHGIVNRGGFRGGGGPVDY